MGTLKKRAVQIYLETGQDKALTYLAKKNNTSKARLIRLSIDNFLQEKIKPSDDPALDIIGLGSPTKRKDLAEKHDEYLVRSEKND